MRYLDAVEILKKFALARHLEQEQVRALDSHNRVCSADVKSTMTVPPFDNSGVDGFALRSRETLAASSEKLCSFEIVGTLFPGELPPAQTPAGSAWEIMTGAPFPLDCDAAVKVEDTVCENDLLQLRAPVKKNENRRHAGDDFRAGDLVIRKGQLIRAEHLMAFASLGIQQVSVFRRPRVFILSTGKELAEPGESLRPGQIYNSTRTYLANTLEQLGAQVLEFDQDRIVPDDPQMFSSIFSQICKNPPDILITTGAVSMGKEDFIRAGLETGGAVVHFHRVEIRPGKPILFASCDRAVRPFFIFGLPGNPVSSVIGARFFLEPFLRYMNGRESEIKATAKLSHDVSKAPGLRCFQKARIQSVNGTAMIELLDGQPSFMVRPLLDASVWAILPEGADRLQTGDVVEYVPVDAVKGDFHV